MMFKRLRYHKPENGMPTFVPIESEETVDVSLIKATTFLTFLYDNNLLNTAYVRDAADNQWVVYSREQNITFVDILNTDDLSGVDVLVATNQSPMLSRQYGIALVRDSLEHRTTFGHEFMQSTRSWLDKHDDERSVLRDTFLAPRKRLVS